MWWVTGIPPPGTKRMQPLTQAELLLLSLFLSSFLADPLPCFWLARCYLVFELFVLDYVSCSLCKLAFCHVDRMADNKPVGKVSVSLLLWEIPSMVDWLEWSGALERPVLVVVLNLVVALLVAAERLSVHSHLSRACLQRPRLVSLEVLSLPSSKLGTTSNDAPLEDL